MRIENIAVQNTQGKNDGKSVDIDGFLGILEGLIFTKDEDVKKNPDMIEKTEDEEVENLIALEDEPEEEMDRLNLFYPGDLELKLKQTAFKPQDYEAEISLDKLDIGLEYEQSLDLESGELNPFDLESLGPIESENSSLERIDLESIAFEPLDLKSLEAEGMDIESLEFDYLLNGEIDQSLKEGLNDEESFSPVKDQVLDDPIEEKDSEDSSIELATDKGMFGIEVNKEISRESNIELDRETNYLDFDEEEESLVSPKLENEIESLGSLEVNNESITKSEKEIDKAENSKFEDVLIESSPTSLAKSMENKTINPEIEDLGQENIHRITESIIDSVKITNLETSDLIEVQLYPEELGTLNIKLKLEEGKITGTILVENDIVKSLLVKGLSELSNNLAKENVNIEKLEIDIKTGLDSNLANENFNRNQNHEKDFSDNLRNIFRNNSVNASRLENSTSMVEESLGSNSVNILV